MNSNVDRLNAELAEQERRDLKRQDEDDKWYAAQAIKQASRQERDTDHD
jgi:phage-related protein